MEKVLDINGYVHKMEKSLLDKMFFMDKIFDSVENIVDFGCANGVLIRTLNYLFPEYNYIGYDISDEMINMAKAEVPGCTFCSRWEDIDVSFENSLLNISSTLHEVYSYGTEESVNEFWDRVFSSGFKYISIRDMMLSDKIEPVSNEEDVAKARTLFPEKLAQYESIWGPIGTRFNLIHYLLKYRYTENWEREVRENYLPITVQTLLSKIPPEYEIVYQEHYVLPFVKQQIRKDSGITLNDSTHFKLLLKLK